jgi:hypothetical protein
MIDLNPKMVGCVATVLLFGGLMVSCLRNFGDQYSEQSAEECVAQLREPILRKTAAMPSDAELIAKDAVVEHVFHGNSREVRMLRSAFERGGWKVSNYGFEVGDGFQLTEPAIQFRRVARQRIDQLCTTAAQAHVEYESWWLDAPVIADFVAQNSSLHTVQEGS